MSNSNTISAKRLQILVQAYNTQAITNLFLKSCLADYYRFNPKASQGGKYCKVLESIYVKRENWQARCPIIQKGRSFDPILKVDATKTQEENDKKAIPTLKDEFFGIALHHAGNKGYKTPVEVQNHHMDETNRADMGYHFAVGLNGKIYEGRPIGVKGSHLNKYNTGIIGIVFLGDFDHQWWDLDDDITSEALVSVIKLIKALKEQFSSITVLGAHKEWKNNKDRTCPGDHGMEYVSALRKELKQEKTNLPMFKSPKATGHGWN